MRPAEKRVFDILSVAGPLTTSQVAERYGDTPNVVYAHLRRLHVARLVQKASGRKADEARWRVKPE